MLNGQNAEFLNIQSGGTKNNDWVLKAVIILRYEVQLGCGNTSRLAVLSQKYLETTAFIFGTVVKLKVINVLREFLTSKFKDY